MRPFNKRIAAAARMTANKVVQYMNLNDFSIFFLSTRLIRWGTGRHTDNCGLNYDSVLLDPLLSLPLSDFSVSKGFIGRRSASGKAGCDYKNRKKTFDTDQGGLIMKNHDKSLD